MSEGIGRSSCHDRDREEVCNSINNIINGKLLASRFGQRAAGIGRQAPGIHRVSTCWTFIIDHVVSYSRDPIQTREILFI